MLAMRHDGAVVLFKNKMSMMTGFGKDMDCAFLWHVTDYYALLIMGRLFLGINAFTNGVKFHADQSCVRYKAQKSKRLTKLNQSSASRELFPRLHTAELSIQAAGPTSLTGSISFKTIRSIRLHECGTEGCSIYAWPP